MRKISEEVNSKDFLITTRIRINMVASWACLQAHARSLINMRILKLIVKTAICSTRANGKALKVIVAVGNNTL